MATMLGGATAVGYQSNSPEPGIATAPGASDDGTEYWTLTRCKRAYLDYLGSKRREIDEQKESRHYRHGAHWTAEQVTALNNRKQPVVTYNRIGRKIDGIVGLVEKLRQDPKAYPRTPEHEEGAELATAVLRFVMDQQDWNAKSPFVAESGAVDGIGGIELELEDASSGDRDVTFSVIDPDGFFYDPRSRRHDFSDATYMGVGKWLDADTVKDMFPGKEAEIDASTGNGSELTSNSDMDDNFFSESETGERKFVRLVDLWYKHKGEWVWSIFTGSAKLMEGKSYFTDDKGKTACKFVMYSASVDHDGDRYGFVRNLKSANDEVNQRRSKGLHLLNTRGIISVKGHFDDIEQARREAARPDMFLEYNPMPDGVRPEFDDAAKQADIVGQLKFLEDAKAEIENFGPNPALIGTGVNAKSGRAIALMQQAGIAELGPYILAYKGWKVRVYRAVYNAISRNWQAERWVRVTDDEGLAQFVQINAMQVDPQTGMPAMVNAIGQLDVDIVLDEGPDTITMMQDLYETLSNVIPSIAPMLQPQEARAVVKMLIDVSPLSAAQKKGFREATEAAAQPDPMQQQMHQIAMAGEDAKVGETKSKTMLNLAKAQAEGMPEMPGQPQQMEFELPPEIQVAQAAADIDKTQADAMHKRAQAGKVEVDAAMAPMEMMHRARMDQADFAQRAHDSEEDRAVAKQQARQRASNGNQG